MSRSDKQRKLGILIDDRTLRLIELGAAGGNVEVRNARAKVLSSADDASLINALTELLRDLENPPKAACLAVADRSIVFELVPLPPLKAADKAKVIERHAARILQSGKPGTGEILFASRVTREVQKPEGKLDEHLVVAASRATIDRYLRIAEACGIEVECIVPLPEAHFAALGPGSPLPAAEGRLVVDFEHSLSHVSLLLGSSWIYARDLAKAVDEHLLFADSELRLGASEEVFIVEEGAPTEPVAPSAPPSIGAGALPPLLLGEIRRTILFLEREFGVKIPSIVLSGAVKPIPGLLEELSSKLERPATFPQDARISFSEHLGEGAYPSAYTAAIGAYFAAASRDSLNLLPTELRPQSGVSWKRTAALVGSGSSLLVAVALCALVSAEIPEVQSKIQLAQPLVKRALEEESRAQQGTDQSPGHAARVQVLAQLQQNRSPAYFALEEISRSIPATISLEGLRLFRHGGLWIFRCEGTVHEQGSLAEIASFQAFLSGLQHSPLFDRVEFTPFGVEPPEKGRSKVEERKARFRLSAVLKGVSG